MEMGGYMKINFVIDTSLQEVEVVIKTPAMNKQTENLISLLDNYKAGNDSIILGYNDYDVVPIELSSIYYFTVSGEKVLMNTKQGVYETRKRLYELESLSKDFLRISNSEIVAVKEIEKLDLKYSGTIMFLMKNGDELYASRRRISKIKQYFDI